MMATDIYSPPDWHKWFAWHPVKIKGGKIVWLWYVLRKFDYGYYAGIDIEYAPYNLENITLLALGLPLPDSRTPYSKEF